MNIQVMLVSLLVASLGLISLPTHAQVDCASAVSVSGSTISVASDPGFDTENLQCAFDAAVSENLSSVELTDSEYAIGALEIKDFAGTFTGRSIANTSVSIADGAIDCTQADPAVLKFVGGNAAVKSMTITAGDICGGTGESATIIGFYSDAANCSARTLFAQVDRVSMSGPGAAGSDILYGVALTNASACSDKVLGTIKVNRATLSDMAYGVATSLGGRGQADINFNTFSGVGLPVAIVNANQSTTLLQNTFAFNDTTDYLGITGFGNTAVFIGSDENAPSQNSTFLSTNTFNNGGAMDSSYAVLTGQSGKAVSHRLIVGGNIFNGTDVEPGEGNPDSGLPADPIAFATDFEDESLTGWSAYVNVFSENCSTYLKGYPFTLDGAAVGIIVDGSESKVLNVFSDYDSSDLPGACLETNVYRELIVAADNVGTYEFSYEVEPPESPGDQVFGYINVLDQSAGFTDIAGVTPVASTPGPQSLSVTIDESMVGKLLQFGFKTLAVDYDNSGMLYDNVSFAAVSSGGGGDLGGSGVGVFALDTSDGVMFSNRFAGGAETWFATDQSAGASAVSGWGLLGNNFGPSEAATDIYLGAGTAGLVVGSDQGDPRVDNDGDNDVLEGAGVTMPTAATATEAAAAQFDAELGRLVD